jgi:hypothetical protein
MKVLVNIQFIFMNMRCFETHNSAAQISDKRESTRYRRRRRRRRRNE